MSFLLDGTALHYPAQSKQDHETWVEDEVTNTLNTFDLGDIRATQLIAFEQNQRSEVRETGVAGPIKAEKGSNNQTFIAQQKVYENHGTDSRVTEVDVSPTITARTGTGGNNLPLVSETKNWDGKETVHVSIENNRDKNTQNPTDCAYTY